MPEHVPPVHEREVGITGRFRFRAQKLTSRPVLQVEVVIRRTRRGIRSFDRTDTTWRDATIQEATQIQYGTGFVKPEEPEPVMSD
ncbi:hypothetical protein [Xenorhabdus innexi]|uniref:Uncharacterized protein n=1 Tax=Xenorhabdus innexi TaxID=290109 RepID=A0A1N6MWU7_9GAMM|nr:hypothetical protein [Xenorhabdus innexi]PHM33315.1 hypothetical protein Xinn_02572 [Xenorhabdus innexi]SIP73306.1 hypothetical protein XIS1_1800029 [Xenorhabdus innexi]